MQTLTLAVANLPDIEAHLAVPATSPAAGIVVIQEIFGANAHIRAVTQRFADAGYLAVAPALFDVVSPGEELDYNVAGTARGKELATAVGFERALQVIQAAREVLSAKGAIKVGCVGFCWGGSLAFLSNTRLGMPSVSYYGARTVPFLNEPLRAPMMFHFGDEDSSIPASDIEATRRAQPGAELFVYKGAGHAFNRDVDPTHFNEKAARLANERTLAFFAEALL